MYAIITGASSGIGRDIARELAQRKYDLILVARRKDRLEELKKELESSYPIQVLVHVADLSDLKQCHQLHEDVKHLPIEIVVNNAGFGKVGNYVDVPLETEINMLELNILALHTLTKLFVASMEKGVILNVGSMAAFLPTPLLSTYAASKAYVVSMSRAVDHELRKSPKDLRVLTLCPGPVKTEFGIVAEARDLALPGIESKKCAEVAVKGIIRRKSLIIPGFRMKLIHFFLRFLPTRLVLSISYHFQNKKR